MERLKKVSRMLVTMVFVFMGFILVNSNDTYATQYESTTIRVDKTVELDENHSIGIHAEIDVDYAWDEGYVGWIENAYVHDNGGVGSNTVIIDELYPVWYDYVGSSYYEKYYFRGMVFGDYFTGYIYLYVSCDEWGEVTGWARYEEI